MTDTLVGQCVPVLRDAVGLGMTFIIFACILALHILLAWKIMPETAGRLLGEIERWHKKQ